MDEDNIQDTNTVFYQEPTHKIIVKLTHQGHTYSDDTYSKDGELNHT
jgi:hypothetical protein